MLPELFRPPWDWFQDPEFTEPHPGEVADTGRVRGHLILRTGHHAWEPGPSSCGYAYFHRHRITVTHDDTEEIVGVGQITMLDLTPVAYVRVGDDSHGLWVAGGLHHTVSPGVRESLMRGLYLSGEWSNKELIGIVSVPRWELPGVHRSAL